MKTTEVAQRHFVRFPAKDRWCPAEVPRDITDELRRLPPSRERVPSGNIISFDDFENKPLHGTFLIDGNGLVRWQDISYEPFTDIDFLLKKSKRLLKLPPN